MEMKSKVRQVWEWVLLLFSSVYAVFYVLPPQAPYDFLYVCHCMCVL